MKRLITLLLIAGSILVTVFAHPPGADALVTTIRVGYCRNMPPYQYETASGAASGFHVDLLEEIAEDADLLLEYIGFDATTEAVEALEKGNVDIVLGVIEDQFPYSELQYTRAISSANICLIASKEAAERYRSGNRNMPLAVEYQIIGYTYVSSISHGDVLLTGNQIDTLRAEQQGRVDLALGIKESLLWYLNAENALDHYDILINYVNSADFAIAIRGGDGYLKDELDHGVQEIRTDGTYARLYDTWFHEEDGTRYLRILRYVGFGAGALAIVLLSYFIISRRTRQTLAAMVEARTGELNLANAELERKNLEIREENELRRSIIEASPAAMAVFDSSFRIRYLNSHAEALILSDGCKDPDNLQEIPMINAIMEEVGYDMFARDWLNRAGTMEMRNSIGGIEKKYRYSCHKINQGGPDPEAFLSVEDITVEDREREAVFEKKKNETLNQLIVGIAHEVKNPLTAIQTSVDMMQEQGNNERYWKAFSTYIPAEVERITKLINNLVGYARPAAGQNEPVELKELLTSAYNLASVSAKGIIVEKEIGDEEIYVNCDRDRIKQSLMNVIFNGIESGQKKALQDKKPHHVNIHLWKDDVAAWIEIRDDGVGMTAEEMQRCTEPFYTTKPTGTGIGLAVTKQYLDEIGGTMSLYSEKDRYTRVVMRLPLMTKEQEAKK